MLDDYRQKRRREEIERAKQQAEQRDIQRLKTVSKYAAEEQVSECLICYSNIRTVVWCPCGHMNYCEPCYIQHMAHASEPQCPSCRSIIQMKDTFYLVQH